MNCLVLSVCYSRDVYEGFFGGQKEERLQPKTGPLIHIMRFWKTPSLVWSAHCQGCHHQIQTYE